MQKRAASEGLSDRLQEETESGDDDELQTSGCYRLWMSFIHKNDCYIHVSTLVSPNT